MDETPGYATLSAMPAFPVPCMTTRIVLQSLASICETCTLSVHVKDPQKRVHAFSVFAYVRTEEKIACRQHTWK